MQKYFAVNPFYLIIQRPIATQFIIRGLWWTVRPNSIHLSSLSFRTWHDKVAYFDSLQKSNHILWIWHRNCKLYCIISRNKTYPVMRILGLSLRTTKSHTQMKNIVYEYKNIPNSLWYRKRNVFLEITKLNMKISLLTYYFKTIVQNCVNCNRLWWQNIAN